MNVVNTSDLRPGQIFSAPVYSESEYMLVSANVPLRQRDIDVLNTWGIEYVRTDGELIDTNKPIIPTESSEQIMKALEEQIRSAIGEPEEIPEVEAIEENEGKKGESPEKAAIKFSITDVRQNSGTYRKYKSLIEKVNALFSGLKSGADVDMRSINNLCVQLLQDLRDNMDNFVEFILGGEVSGHELAKSSVNTAILSALTAQELKLPNHKINNIVAGALLHDVGMLRLSKGITEKKGGLSDAEFEQIKSHTVHSSKIVSKELFGNNEVNLIALHHHERWDGKGYPDQLAGNAIDMGARIVSVADAFEAMVSKKSYRESIVGYQAVKNMLADNARRFDPAVIMAFTKIMGIYPIGSIIRLNDESVARVLSVNSNAPMRPIVEILISKAGQIYKSGKGEVIDLLADKSLFIKKAMDPAEFAATE